MHTLPALILIITTLSVTQAQPDSAGRIYISRDEGTTWQKADHGFPSDDMVNAWVVKDNLLIAGTNAHGIYVTYDKTKNWYATGKGLPPQTRIISMVVHNHMVFAGTFTDGVFLSTDNGDHWKSANVGLRNLNVRVLHSMGSTLLAGVDDGLYKSTNGGASWVMVKGGMQVNAIRRVDNKLYVATHQGVMTSVDAGENWTWIYQGAIFKLTANRQEIFILDYSGRVYRAPTDEIVWLKADVYLPFTYTFRLTRASEQFFISDWQPGISSLTSTKNYRTHGLADYLAFTELISTPFGLLAGVVQQNREE